MNRILSFFISIVCFAVPGIGHSQKLSKKQLESSVAGISKLIDQYYVFPEKGKRIATQLMQAFRNGNFDEISDWSGFDSVVTKWLRGFSHDGHLYVRNDPKRVIELVKAQKQVEDSTSTEQYYYDPFYYGPEAIEKNFGFDEVKVLDQNIGYIKLSQINISSRSLPVLYAAMEFVSNTKAMIIDLRNNGGGGSEIGSVFQSFFLPKDMPLLEFKTRSGAATLDKTVLWLTQKKYEKPLFIIINKRTASAAEEFAYSMQNKKRATIVGQPSAGAANMNTWYVVNDQIYLSVSTAAPTIPGTEESWEQTGIRPDHTSADGGEIELIRRLVE